VKIGILDIQGSVEEHFAALSKCGLEVVLVKKIADFDEVSGLIIPGGESTTIGKLLEKFELDKAIIAKFKKGMAIWGTCAGAILLAKRIVEDSKVNGLKLMDVEVSRNAYGRQIDSFETEINFGVGKDSKKIPAVFIRAPKISSIGKNVKILAKYKNEIIAAREGKLLATTFHPEMTNNLEVHKYFVKMC
jgi:5'-phosphate synthase pdxT subunit